MATVAKQKIESHITEAQHTKFRRKTKRNRTTMAKVIRDAVKAYLKPKKA